MRGHEQGTSMGKIIHPSWVCSEQTSPNGNELRCLDACKPEVLQRVWDGIADPCPLVLLDMGLGLKRQAKPFKLISKEGQEFDECRIEVCVLLPSGKTPAAFISVFFPVDAS